MPQVTTLLELVSMTALDPENATENWYSQGVIFDFHRKWAAEISQTDKKRSPKLHYHPYKNHKWTGQLKRYNGVKELENDNFRYSDSMHGRSPQE